LLQDEQKDISEDMGNEIVQKILKKLESFFGARLRY
jgi:hypothetical protein